MSIKSSRSLWRNGVSNKTTFLQPQNRILPRKKVSQHPPFSSSRFHAVRKKIPSISSCPTFPKAPRVMRKHLVMQDSCLTEQEPRGTCPDRSAPVVKIRVQSVVSCLFFCLFVFFLERRMSPDMSSGSALQYEEVCSGKPNAVMNGSVTGSWNELCEDVQSLSLSWRRKVHLSSHVLLWESH